LFVDDIDNGDYSDNKDYIDYNIREGFISSLSEFTSNEMVFGVSRLLHFYVSKTIFLGFRGLRFLCLWVLQFYGFKVSRNREFEISGNQDFTVSRYRDNLVSLF
jgi:hypothetical protein